MCPLWRWNAAISVRQNMRMRWWWRRFLTHISAAKMVIGYRVLREGEEHPLCTGSTTRHSEQGTAPHEFQEICPGDFERCWRALWRRNDISGDKKWVLGFYAMHGPVDSAASAGVWVGFQKHPPRRVNGLYGYRTARSMKSQELWDFAQRLCGKLWWRLGWGLLLLSAAVMLLLLGRRRRRWALAGRAAGSTDSGDAGFDCPGGKGAETQGPRLTAPHRKNTSGGCVFCFGRSHINPRLGAAGAQKNNVGGLKARGTRGRQQAGSENGTKNRRSLQKPAPRGFSGENARSASGYLAGKTSPARGDVGTRNPG